jgi:hypothetical protein
LRPVNKYRQSKSPHEYFYQRVILDLEDKDSCWKFNTAGDKDGYPQIGSSIAYKELGVTRAHQLSYVLHVGNIPSGMQVCHTCDNPSCVNPSHLFLGTPNDNVQDMVRKGRYIHPTKAGYVYKLTEEDKQNIKTYKGILSSDKVAGMFNISFSRVCQIWRGE